MNDGAERWKRSRKTDWEEQCSPRLWCSPIFLYIIVLNLGTIRLQRTKRGIKHQPRWRQKAKFTFPFWKLRKSELFYLQLFFGGGFFESVAGFFSTRSIEEERNFLFASESVVLFKAGQGWGKIGAARTLVCTHSYLLSVCSLAEHVNHNSKMKLLLSMCFSELHLISSSRWFWSSSNWKYLSINAKPLQHASTQFIVVFHHRGRQFICSHFDIPIPKLSIAYKTLKTWNDNWIFAYLFGTSYEL